MAKLRITEAQLERLRKNLNEDTDDNRYQREVTLNVITSNASFKGNEINDIPSSKIRVSYVIEQDVRSWGIKDISLYAITGPEQVEIEVDYYVDSDNTMEETTVISLDWSKITVEEFEGKGIITVGDEVEVYVGNDNEGNLIVNEINVVVYTL